MKRLINKKWIQVVLIALLSVLYGNNLSFAGTNYEYVNQIDPAKSASVDFEPESGRYHIKFKYYYNPTNSAKDVSLISGSYIQARWNSTDHKVMDLKGCSDCEHVDYSNAPSNDTHGWVKVGNDFKTSGRFSQNVSDGTAATADFYYYPPTSALGYTPTFYFYFKIEEDEDGEGSMVRDATINPGKTLPDINGQNLKLIYSYSNTVNKLDMTVNYTGGTVPTNLYWGSTPFNSASMLTKQTDRVASGGTLSQKITLKFSEKVNKEVTVSTPVKGYQAIQNFSAAYQDGGTVKLTWSMESGTGTMESDYFVIERSLYDNFTNAEKITTTLAYASSQTSYAYIDDLTSAGISDPKIYYRITRTTTLAQWGFDFGQSTHVEPNYQHVQITSAASVLTEADGYDAIKVTWNYNSMDYIWSTDSRFMIVRNNTTTGTSQEIAGLSKNDIETKEYIDRAIQKCNTYKYEVFVLPGNTKFVANKCATEPITPSKMGDLVSADASKGYYSDRIEVDWKSHGTFDKFSISRRLHGDGEDAWQTIQTLDGASVLEDYMTSDPNAKAGYIYDYRIIGLLNCSDSVLSSNAVYATGFRTPTGEFYGQVTFPDGQAEDSVEVRLSTTETIEGQSMYFAKDAYGRVQDNNLLADNGASVSLQAWILPDALTTVDQHILTKPDMYDLGINNGHPYFQIGSTRLTVDSETLSTTMYTQLTAVYDADTKVAQLYVNGLLVGTREGVNHPNASNSPMTMGNAYAGYIEEVRVWSLALSQNSVESDYGRHLAGNEEGLAAYYNFDYTFDDQVFDMSFTISGHNKHHVQLIGAQPSNVCPTANQLSFKGITNKSGIYSILGVPYYGNSTAYTLTPLKGVHSFVPVSEIRLISPNVQNHTVNFKDESSFKVSGTVRYAGGTMPVEGAWFVIDGSEVKNSNGSLIKTDANGQFLIQVPVGIHEVKVVKDGHVFEKEGKITMSNGQNRNYQDDLSGLELWDNTRVKFIGRVAGGVIQEGYPVGLSLSTNNLGEGMKLVLSHKRPGQYKLASKEQTEQFAHYVDTLFNTQTTGEDGITITVNDTTGEFVAYVPPITYGMRIDGTDYDFGILQDFNFDNVVLIDTFEVNGKDTVRCNKAMRFIKRFEPIVDIRQLDENGKKLSYFGEEKSKVSLWNNEAYVAQLYDASKDTYLFGKPVFQRGSYTFDLKICEVYTYFDKNGDPVWTDSVPTQDATVEFTNELNNQIEEVEADSLGHGIYKFSSVELDPTSAESHIWAKVRYGDSSTSFDWVPPFTDGAVYTLGYWNTGIDFVTAGPNKVLTVLRDPPGSTSYSYLEKGVTFTESSTYTGSVENEGFQGAAIAMGFEIKTFAGFGAGTVQEDDATTTATIGAVHAEQYEGSDSKVSTTTITTHFQTSDDPLYVGANGDVYIGYSTNITFGSTGNITLMPKSVFNNAGGEDAYEKVYDDTPQDWVLVQTKGRNVEQSFSTTFAYPQVYIEQSLIPNMESIRNSFLIPYRDQAQIDSLQDLADRFDTIFYVSYWPADSEFFGLPNSDSRLEGYKNTYGDSESTLDGPSYNVVYTNKTKYANIDTINTINQWIRGWQYELGRNEYQKLMAQKDSKNRVENYSLQAGASLEYSESYSAGKAHESSFSITLGAAAGYESDIEISHGHKSAVSYKMEETLTTTQGGTFSTETERSHCKGFVLAEDGDDDYLSITVYREPNWKSEDEEYDYEGNLSQGNTVDSTAIEDKDYFSSFIFVTEGGATSCPYEDAYYAKYLDIYKEMAKNPDKLKSLKTDSVMLTKPTMRLEVPYISMENNFMENVPSGEPAYFTVYMRNNSETGEDQWFKVIAVDESNPDGAMISFDGNTVTGFELIFLVKAGETLVKTMTVEKGRALNYDNLQVVLGSQCQADPTSFLDVIADTITFSVHFLPTCTDLDIVSPSNNWTYNTKCKTAMVNGLEKHYMPIKISNFDANYTDFDHIEFQYKPASGSDYDWSSLCYWYADSTLYDLAIQAGNEAHMILASDAGTLTYNFFMDELPDQKYDLRAVSVCNINNTLYENPSAVISGIKDMYNPRLFGAAKPANGILTVEDEIRLDFNEPIAEGLLTENNFTVTGIRNGASTNHDVSIQLDGTGAYLTTELQKNYANKDLTIEGWITIDKAQNATLFSHGDVAQSLAFAITSDNYVKVRFGKNEYMSDRPAAFQLGSWNNVALTYDAQTEILTAYVNWVAVIEQKVAQPYTGIGQLQIGRDIASEDNYFDGKVDQFRVWNACRTASQLQANSAVQLSGNDVGLIGYYAMDEARGSATEDKARGVNMILENAEWALPDGHSIQFDGKSGYLTINTSAAIVTEEMDYTLEFWFKTDKEQVNATMLCNGDGISNVAEDPFKLFSVGWNKNGVLCYRNNGYETEVPGDWCDGEWHQFSFTISRSTGHARIYMDGQMITYIAADMVGSISSDMMYAGARVWYTNPQETTRTADQFFDGKIDEIRLWKLYRTQSQMEELSNQKLNGDEIGLLLYYPFEHYITYQGVQELQYTTKDYVTDTLSATSSGNTLQSSDIAPVRTQGSVSKLRYDFVVNNDALIITMKEDDYRIENTIVTFTAEDIRDLNGNSILSPITWSAYIDRNQLMWQDDEISITKQQYEDYQFQIGITNKGGYVQNFTIENLPSWLTATPSSGTLNPTKSTTITFTVNSGLNVGTYNEVIYLVDAENVSEPLSLNVTVKGEEPTWEVNPGDFQYNMSIFGQMRVDGVFSMDENDILAAFDGKTCVGNSRTTYNEATDMFYVLLTVYGNSQNSTKPLTFRMYDASTGTIYSAVPSETITFINNKVYGTPMNPVLFDCGEMYFNNIELKKGWNWISFNLENKELNDINTALNGAEWLGGEQVKDLYHSATYSAKDSMWNVGGGLTGFDIKGMYMVRVDTDKVLPVSGNAVDPTTVNITVAANRWNYIGYLPQNTLPVKTALAGYNAQNGDIVKSQNAFAMYFGNEWVGSLNYMKPTEGYMLKNIDPNNDKSLTYPSKASTLNRAPVRSINGNYPYNMSVFGHCSMAQEGDVIYAIVNGEICGQAVAVPYENNELQCISIAGSDMENGVNFVLVRNGDTYTSTTVVRYKANAVVGTPDEPLEINFETESSLANVAVYPVPAVTDINVTAVLKQEAPTYVEIYDVIGKRLIETPAAVCSDVYVRSINVTALGAGTYFLRLVNGENVEVTKFVKY